jgi:hypothetical protein
MGLVELGAGFFAMILKNRAVFRIIGVEDCLPIIVDICGSPHHDCSCWSCGIRVRITELWELRETFPQYDKCIKSIFEKSRTARAADATGCLKSPQTPARHPAGILDERGLAVSALSSSPIGRAFLFSSEVTARDQCPDSTRSA